MMPDEMPKRIEQIRQAVASAKPKPAENPAFANAHADLTVALERIAELEAENDRFRLGGHRLEAALSRIDYLCGPPNDMEVSGYDVHCDEAAVVRAVEGIVAENKRLREALAASPLPRVAHFGGTYMAISGFLTKDEAQWQAQYGEWRRAALGGEEKSL